MGSSSGVAGFLPSVNGLHFANRFPPGPTLKLGPFDPRIVGIGDASSGLCGGFTWYVRERFEAGLPVPADTEPPANGSRLFQALVRRQVQSLGWMRTPLDFWSSAAFGAARTARRSREIEWPRIRATVDRPRLAMVGLVRHRGRNPMNMTQSHQVLVFGYEVHRDTVTLKLYDPNWPDRDDVVVVMDHDGLRQSTGEALSGIIALG